jgi:hypothetical protein
MLPALWRFCPNSAHRRVEAQQQGACTTALLSFFNRRACLQLTGGHLRAERGHNTVSGREYIFYTLLNGGRLEEGLSFLRTAALVGSSWSTAPNNPKGATGQMTLLTMENQSPSLQQDPSVSQAASWRGNNTKWAHFCRAVRTLGFPDM